MCCCIWWGSLFHPTIPTTSRCKHRKPRLPIKIHDCIVPNPLNPLVLTADWFTKWLMPYGIAKMDQTSHIFPAHTIITCCLIMANCVLPSTLDNYPSGLIHFTRFCNDFQVLEADCMPALESLLSMFISTHAAGSVSKVQ